MGLLLAVLAPRVAGQTPKPVETLRGSGITIMAVNVYDQVPPRGFVPLRITITNASDSAGSWDLNAEAGNSFNDGVFTTTAHASVPAHAEKTFELLAALPEWQNNQYSRPLRLSVSGPGTLNRDVSWETSSNYYSGRPGRRSTSMGDPRFVGLSLSLNRDLGSALQDYEESTAACPYTQIALDPNLLAADWRSYLGFDAVVFNAQDWLSLSLTQRAAILQWVAAGGELRLLADQSGGLNLPARTDDHYGAGVILLFPPNSASSTDLKTHSAYNTERYVFNFYYNAAPVQALALAPAIKTPPVGNIPAPVPPPPPLVFNPPHLGQQYALVAIFIAIFVALVGPLNLFVFCRGSHRTRLLWVTPLLSLAATLMLGAYILVSDGIGGRGVYYRLTQLEPDGKFAVESQISSCVTGLLLHTDFNVSDSVWILPYKNSDHEDSLTGVFAQDGKHYTGNWLASRREQTLYAAAVVPSRAALLLVTPTPQAGVAASAGVSLRSEYNGTLKKLYYLDASGNAWKTDSLTDGETQKLVPIGHDEIARAWQNEVSASPGLLRSYMREVTPTPGTFFALGDDSQAGLEPQSAGLGWTCFRHVVVGPVQP